MQKLSSLPGLEHLPHKGCWDSAEVTIRPCDILWPETPMAWLKSCWIGSCRKWHCREETKSKRKKIHRSLLFDPGFLWLGPNFLLVPPAPSVPAVHTQPTHESPHEPTLVGAMFQGSVSIRRLACSPIYLPLIKTSSDNSRGSNYCSLCSPPAPPSPSAALVTKVSSYTHPVHRSSMS